MNYGIGNPKGEKGKDGVSPIVSVEAITGGYEITITDANGTQTFTIMNGQDGTNGTNGTTPNISVNANVNNSVGTPSVSVVKTGTDSEPTFAFTFQNLKGEPGTTTIKTQIVNSLPSTGATDTIYFVPNNSGESENLYNEYLYINNAWERVDSKIDLSNYIQKSNTSGLVKNDGTIDTSAYVTMNDIKNEPVLIWENSNPNTAFSGQTLSNLPDLSQYQYLIIAYRQSVGSGYPIIYQKVKPYTFSNTSYYTLCWFAQNTSIITQISRDIIFKSNTEITIVDCYSDKQVYNEGLVPIALYGTNIL